MIVFYTETFELNVTNINIKFIEESSFFFDAFYKNYTPPFVMPMDEETSEKLGLIDVDNITDYTVKHKGKLFIDNDFFDAYLLIEVENEYIEGSFYYGTENLPILETPLKELPFVTIQSPGIDTLVNDYVTKSWPEVSCNFPMVYDDAFSKKTNYDEFLGVINNRALGTIIFNSIDIEGKLLNKNVITPFPYILEILKVGFAAEGKSITGGFVQKKENAHLLLDVKNHLEKFSSSTFEDIQFNNHTDQYLDSGVLISEFKHQTIASAIGTYNIKISINLPSAFKVKSFQLIRDTTVIFESTSNSIQKEISVNKETALGTVVLYYVLLLEGNVNSIINYNNINFQKGEGKLNVFKDTFLLSEVMPDMTFGGFLQKLKNWLNLKIEIKNNYVKIDYVEEIFNTIDYKDEREFEILQPKREFNQTKRYKLTTSNPDSEIIVDKLGLNASVFDIREADIVKIDTGVSIYPIEERNGIFTAVRNEASDFGILIYNGLDANSNPVVAPNIDGANFSLQEVYTKYWKKWLYFRLNSETYTDKFTAHSLEEFSTLVGRFKYNKKHIIKKITKQRVSEEEFMYEIESETI